MISLFTAVMPVNSGFTDAHYWIDSTDCPISESELINLDRGTFIFKAHCSGILKRVNIPISPPKNK